LPPLINARSETVAKLARFRMSFKRRRCIIPASGFHEWRTEGKDKYPNYIRLKHGLMPFAGIWETWQGPDGVVQSAAIITTAANELIGKFHDRMPCILEPGQFAAWLDPKSQTPDELLPTLQSYRPDRMECWPVDSRVNTVKGGNDAGLIDRVKE
jgi:putative SOS response-associated peptidase YedK